MDLSMKSPQFNSLLEHLKRMDSDELFAAQEAVESLERHPGWAVVTDLIDHVHGIAMQRLKNSGGRLEQSEYADVLGKLAGLEVLAQVPKAVLLAAERAEERLENANAETAGVN